MRLDRKSIEANRRAPTCRATEVARVSLAPHEPCETHGSGSKNTQRAELRKKVRNETKEFFATFLYWAVFLCVLSTYTMRMLYEFDVKYFTCGAALLNARVLSKVTNSPHKQPIELGAQWFPHGLTIRVPTS